MKKTFIILTALAFIILVTVIACNTKSNYVEPNTVGITEISTEDKADRIKRGEYLVNIMGCDDCHTPKVMGPKGPELDIAHRFSGHPATIPVAKINQQELKSWVMFNMTGTTYVGPWGVSFAANISSDDTGIGTWSEAQFLNAIKKGKYKGLDNSRELLPPMPWPVYKNATDEDLKAIYAFLKTSAPVENIVPAAITPERLIAVN